MTHYRSHQMRAFKASASDGNVIIVHSDDVVCESVTAVPTGECAGTGDVICIGIDYGTPSCWDLIAPSVTELSYAEKSLMFPVIPDKPPLNRAERRALKFKKGGR